MYFIALEIQKETSCILISAKEKQSLRPLFNILENKIKEITLADSNV